MYWNVIDESRKEILKRVTEKIEIGTYYMIGGTALALQSGIRESFDFDFCVKEKFDTNLLMQDLNKLGTLKLTFISENTLHCILDNVQLTFMYFPNKLIDELIAVNEYRNLYLASVKDIAAMKLIAISQRGTKKDFFDLYYICKNNNITISEILSMLNIKYNEEKLNYFHIIKSLIYFEDAEDEILPKTNINYNWEEIKEFYINEYKKSKI